MTKKHFKALAAALRSARPADYSGPEQPGQRSPPALGTYTPTDVVWVNAGHAVADVCASTNPRFNRSKFLSACGMEEA